MSNLTGKLVAVAYRGEKSNEVKNYFGTVESEKNIGGRVMVVVKLSSDSGYRSFYLDRTEKFELV